MLELNLNVWKERPPGSKEVYFISNVVFTDINKVYRESKTYWNSEIIGKCWLRSEIAEKPSSYWLHESNKIEYYRLFLINNLRYIPSISISIYIHNTKKKKTIYISIDFKASFSNR